MRRVRERIAWVRGGRGKGGGRELERGERVVLVDCEFVVVV